jgi:hypothetical protein
MDDFQIKNAQELKPGDIVGFVYGGYGELLLPITETRTRSGLVEVTGVDDQGPFFHQTLFDEGADVQVWPENRKGTWR